jgi:hypothetical protein
VEGSTEKIFDWYTRPNSSKSLVDFARRALELGRSGTPSLLASAVMLRPSPSYISETIT